MTAPSATAGGVLWRIGSAGDIPSMEGRGVVVGERRIAVFRLGDGDFTALDGECPHRGGPLGDGLVAESCVTCPLHNWRIDLRTGEVVSGGEGRVRTYEVVERDGDLYLRIELGAGDRIAA